MSYWQDPRSGVWWCRFYADGTKSGPRPRRRLGGERMPAAEAKRRYEILRGQAAARRNGFAEAPTLEELVEEWKPLRLPGYSVTWRAWITKVLEKRLVPELGHLVLDDEGGLRRGPRLTLLEIERYRARRERDETRPATRNRRHGASRSDATWLEMPRNPRRKRLPAGVAVVATCARMARYVALGAHPAPYVDGAERRSGPQRRTAP